MILRISPVFCLVLALVAFAQIQASAAPNDDEEEGEQWFKLIILRRKFKKGQVEFFLSYLALNAKTLIMYFFGKLEVGWLLVTFASFKDYY